MLHLRAMTPDDVPSSSFSLGEGRGKGGPDNLLSGCRRHERFSESPVLRPAVEEQIPEIARLDFEATATRRAGLLDRLYRERPESLRVAMLDGRITGYGHVRVGSRARQIGPVVARDASSGLALLDAAIGDVRGAAIYLDVPVPNVPAARWAESRGLRVQRQFTRMRRGDPVADQPEWLWAAFGPEKG